MLGVHSARGQGNGPGDLLESNPQIANRQRQRDRLEQLNLAGRLCGAEAGLGSAAAMLILSHAAHDGP